MKKTFVLSFEYDEDKPTVHDTFGITESIMDASQEKMREAVAASTSKTAAMMRFIESYGDDPDGVLGGVLMHMLTIAMFRKQEPKMPGGILGAAMMGIAMTGGLEIPLLESMPKGDIERMMKMFGPTLGKEAKHEHDCEHCDIYDECPLPFKKPRSSDPEQPNG